MTEPSPGGETLTRENAYLRQRNAQLQTDVGELTAEINRLHQIVERLHGRTAAQRPDPLGGGQ
jgi:prefoldin subunit 5